MSARELNESYRPAGFATTRWSIVVSAGQSSSPDSTAALATLCETYWFPLYAYARRRVGRGSEAQDLTQAFFVSFLEKNYAGDADPERGRFRAFLLTAFKHFLSKEWDRANAVKRGGGKAPLSLDFNAADSSLQLDPASGLTPEQLYDQQWGITLLERVLSRLAAEHDGNESDNRFERLKLFLIADNPGITYQQVSEELQMSEVAVRKAVSRLRQRYGELLRAEIGETVSDPMEVDAEIRNLFATFQL